jgi:hypothetical protein
LYTYVDIYVYIYIYRERERERERDKIEMQKFAVNGLWKLYIFLKFIKSMSIMSLKADRKIYVEETSQN